MKRISQRSREIHDRLARGWNTWDVNSVAAHVFLPDMLRVHLSFTMPDKSVYLSNVLWDNVDNFGEHAVDGAYTDVVVKFLDRRFGIETASQERELVMKVTPLAAAGDCFVVLEATNIWGSRFTVSREGDTIAAQPASGAFVIDALSPIATPDWNPSYAPSLTCSAETPVYFRVNSHRSAAEIDAMIAERKRDWLSEVITADGELGDGLAAMRRCLLWNMIYESRSRRVLTPVTRNWCRYRDGTWFGDFVIFGWDTFFAAMQYGLINKDLAYATAFSILEEITVDGLIPNAASGAWRSFDHSQPAIGSLCIWKLYQQFGDVWFIEECFDRLLTWNRWRFRARDFNHDGLLELGSNVWTNQNGQEEYYPEGPRRQDMMNESGLDNSPMWDAAVVNRDKKCMELSYVGLNAEMVLDCELLAKMALLLGREPEHAELESRRARLIGLINTHLWDEAAACYMNRHWSGAFDSCMALQHFYTITAGIAEGERLEVLLKRHLLNEDEFWGEYVIPNVSRKDPSFRDQEYWRGRIWPPTNFLIGEGLLRVRERDAWDDLVRKGLGLFVKHWREKGIVGENYNAITGEVKDLGVHAVPGTGSDRFYHWGTLLVYMGVESVIDFNEWDNCVDVRPMPAFVTELRNVPVGDGRITIVRDVLTRANSGTTTRITKPMAFDTAIRSVRPT